MCISLRIRTSNFSVQSIDSNNLESTESNTTSIQQFSKSNSKHKSTDIGVSMKSGSTKGGNKRPFADLNGHRVAKKCCNENILFMTPAHNLPSKSKINTVPKKTFLGLKKKNQVTITGISLLRGEPSEVSFYLEEVMEWNKQERKLERNKEEKILPLTGVPSHLLIPIL